MDEKNSLKYILATSAQLKLDSTTQTSISMDSNQKAHTLMQKLDLCKYYPKRLQLKDALCIRQEPLFMSINKVVPTDPKQLPLLILHKLMAYDSLCRTDLMSAVVASHQRKEVDDESGSESDSNTDSDDDDSDGIHPVDCLLSLIFCCDDFLRQDLFSRLAKCQLAVPLIIPDPFTKELILPLWGLRSIIKEWVSIRGKDEVVMNTLPIIRYRTPIVSFIRIGKHSLHVKSKSAILNEVISNTHYDHFFHRDCRGGYNKRVLGDGMVDMCWYLPEKTAETFHDAITFLNLHGDIREHLQQAHFLSKISSMCFILITEERLKLDDKITEILTQFSSSIGGITILGGVTRHFPKLLKKKRVIDLSKTNTADITSIIQAQIKEIVSTFSETFQSIEECCSTKETVFLIDECKSSYKYGSRQAAEIKAFITNNSASKDSLLPLQGCNLWRKWAEYEKEGKRQTLRGAKSVNQYSVEITGKKTSVRREQLRYVKALTPIMRTFVSSLLTLRGSSNRIVRNYFLQCLKLELNNLSQENISDLQYQFQCKRKELYLLSKKETSGSTVSDIKKTKIIRLKSELEKLQETIINSSIGLEHFFRELGQIYEAAKYFTSESQSIDLYTLDLLPEVAAELMIDGYPMELMDGDAAHVPLEWVTAVLEKAVKKLNNPDVYVLSVLGLQSTGKSTMLNTVFGLQFNVSAGRCTRGAFMQLLPLDTEVQTKCSYVLVVDTEGLRAPELDPLKTQKHDNELATFVIGLANKTLINIYGEVPGDMDDILQTSVHAFLRMNEIKFKPSCQFIHQNASEGTKSEVGRVKFTQKLDKFTKEAAEQEKCEEKYKSFNDVIKFNDQTDVHYFPGLWRGEPPMAPIDQGYSRSAQELKLHLLKSVCDDKLTTPGETTGSSDLHLSTFTLKLKDLWDSLLKENFVFSFKNTQEIIAYNSLETEFNKWSQECRGKMLEWEQITENNISAIAATYVTEFLDYKYKDLEKTVSELREKYEAEMDSFFSHEHCEILSQWKGRFHTKLITLIEEMRLHARNYCKNLAESKRAISQYDDMKNKIERKMVELVQKYIASTESERDKFNRMLKNKRLDSDQLTKILQQRQFADSENLKHLIKEKLITENQAEQVQAIIDKHHGKLTADVLQEIFFGGILRLEQVKKILKEKELNQKFNEIWESNTDIIVSDSFGSGLLATESIHIEHEVEGKLTEFVHSESYAGELLARLRTKTLRKWGDNLSFLPKESIHYNTPKNFLQRLVPFTSGDTSGKTSPEAAKLVNNVFEKAKAFLENIAESKTDFKPAFVMKLLYAVDSIISKEAESVKKQLTITQEFRLTVHLKVCGYAIFIFETMSRSFREKIDPRIHLERNVKHPLLNNFKNQYYQTEAEEAISTSLCGHIQSAVNDQVRKRIGNEMVSLMRQSCSYFRSKKVLKVKMLTDVYNKDECSYYLEYISNVKQFYQNRLRQYTISFCDEKISDGTRLQIRMKKILSDLISCVTEQITSIKGVKIRQWLSTFFKHPGLIGKMGSLNVTVDTLLTGYDLESLKLDNFKAKFKSRLQDVEKDLHTLYSEIRCEKDMVQWKHKPHDLLADLIGCTEQCPFCGEQCDLLPHDTSQDHRCSIHRPSCLAGWRDSVTAVMTPDFCPSLLANDRTFIYYDEKKYKYRQYRTLFPKWDIKPDNDCEDCKYWKYFIVKYAGNLESKFGFKARSDIPIEWLRISRQEVLESLRKSYNI